jgi:proton translocating ATP synthase F1 alpha subunit
VPAVNEDFGSGSLTALPIIETLSGDLSAYIPTNVISITDGQIFLEEELFKSGIRPAINLNLSVSRVGSAAQKKLMKTISGNLKFYLAWYKEIQIFSSFASDLDDTTLLVLNRGSKLVEILKQKNYNPLTMEEQFILIFAGLNGLLDSVPLEKISKLETHILEEFKKYEFYISEDLKELQEELKESLIDVIKNYE